MTQALEPRHEYDRENEIQHRLAMQRTLNDVHRRGQDLDLGFNENAFRLIFSSAGGVRVAMGLNSENQLVFTGIEDGEDVSEFIIWQNVSGRPDNLSDLDEVAAETIVNLQASSAQTDALIQQLATAGIGRDEALAELSSTLTARLDAAETGLSGQAGALDLITTNVLNLGTDVVALATRATALESSVGGFGASIQSLSETITSNAEASAREIDAVRAEVGGRQLLPNYDFSELDASGFPIGIEPIEGTDQTSHVQVVNGVLRISGAADANVAYGFPAVAVSDQRTYRVTVRHRTSGAPPTSTSLFLRFNELNRALPAGRTHIGNPQGGTASARAVQRTSNSSAYENRAFPGADFEITSFTYRPTPGTQFASFSMYNWTAFRGVYEVDYVEVLEEGTAAAQSAAAAVLRDAFVGADGQAHAAVRLVAAASGATPATIELVSGSDGSGILLGGNTLIGGNLIVQGTITRNGLEVGAISNRETFNNDGNVNFGSNWTTVASRSISTVGGSVAVLGQFNVFAATGPGGGAVRVRARLLRGGTAIREILVGASQVVREQSGGGSIQVPTAYEGTATLIDEDVPSVGTHTYAMQVRTESGAHSGVAGNRTMSIREHRTE